MQAYDLYQDIAQRTQGDVYIGVVGPVRTGKSTFIKRLMETMVIPAIENAHVRARAQDDLPQSGSGKMVMTTKPAFVPAEAVEIALPSDHRVRLRLIDSVGCSGPTPAVTFVDVVFPNRRRSLTPCSLTASIERRSGLQPSLQALVPFCR